MQAAEPPSTTNAMANESMLKNNALAAGGRGSNDNSSTIEAAGNQ